MSKPWDEELDEPSPEELAAAEALAQLLAGQQSPAALPREVEATASLLRLRDRFRLDADADRRIAAQIAERAQRLAATQASTRRAARQRWWLWLLPAAAAIGLWLLVPRAFFGGSGAVEHAADAPEGASQAVEPGWTEPPSGAATRKRIVLRADATADGAAHALPQPAPELLAAQLALLENPGGDRTDFSRHMRAYREQMFAALEGD